MSILASFNRTRQSLLRPAIWRHLDIARELMSYATGSLQRVAGLPFCATHLINQFRKPFLLELVQRSRYILTLLASFTSSYSSYCSWFILLRYSPFSQIEPKFLRRIFFSKVLKLHSSAADMVQDSAPYTCTY